MAINVTQGENKVFTVKLRDANGDPFDLTSFTKYKVCLPLTGGVKLEVTEVANANGSVVALLGNAILGKIEVTLNFNDTASLNEGERQDIGIVLNNAGDTDPRSKNAEAVLNVSAAVC
jgi:hypothetical protein